MGTVKATAERQITASPQEVHALLADYESGRPRILPDSFVAYEVERGGVGAGTVVRYRLRAARRERPYRMAVSEPEPGRVLREQDTESSFRTVWTLTPGGGGTRVQVESTWEGAGGVGGFFERTFAPRGLSRVLESVLDGLERELRDR